MATEPTIKKSYKDTLNLPQTTFPMEAKLVQNEPGRLKKWQEAGLYAQTLAARAGDPQWILHDGPPFANGDIHIGHVINKTLKDVIIRFRSMEGRQTPYVPGWDCHGLPIEHKIAEQIKKEGKNIREMSVLEVRRRCFEYADKYAAVQSEQFQRLGILGDWANPYLTMRPAYEAQTLEVFARIVEKGLVYRKLKPVPWSIANQTALADAELEYEDVTDNSVYVEFKLTQFIDGLPAYLLVWTTTPWTLPANLAVAANAEVEYALVRYSRAGEDRLGLIATELRERVFSKAEISCTVVRTGNYQSLLGGNLSYRHPFIDRTGRVVSAENVTTTDGTGLVHTAPGHGEDDYETGIRENLAVYSPVLYNGQFDDTVPEWLRGKNVFKANPEITQKLADLGLLFAQEKITHSYPHDWRSKTPIIFRATEQWFVAMDKPGADGSAALREMAQRAIRADVEFVPAWGRARMEGMIASRPDWCISRQRAWGLPIPVFYNDKGEPLLTAESVRAVAKRFGEKGSDAWFTDSPAQLLGNDFLYPLGFEPNKLRKEKDIFDVWFESGSSWRAVLQDPARGLHFPADLYLEGSDQHRGWFQLSLLPSLGATGMPPFKQVLTHGFVVKPDGTKVSKSDKEYVKAVDEINRHGADLLRLWCCSIDYQNDIPTSPKAIQEFGDKYRKIRNTLRYLLSNLYDFNPQTDSQPIPPNSLDGWAMAELDTLITDARAGYDAYQLHRVFRLLHDFCSVQISAIYGNAMKDRLYCETPNSQIRRRCQTVMHAMVLALVKLLAPMIVFTADEAWEHIAHKPSADAGLWSVHLAKLPEPSGQQVSDAQRQEWAMLMDLRNQALLQLDKLTRQIGKYKALDAEVIYEVADERLRARLAAYGPDLEDIVGAGFHSFAPKADGPGASAKVVDRREVYKACARSWKRRPDVGSDPVLPDLSARDAKAVRQTD
ncbi:MAG TPA: isoleucine--tRNA ligase [Tepidisphaeraceae bacterium]|nr:isoleucine--tRNA ligase [Tepidisphaeraceae bacterium]